LIIPHLMFAHMLADYTLQTNWLVTRKGKSWDGLLLHGAIVGGVSLVALVSYLDVMWLPLIVLFVVHTTQDFLKVYLGPRIDVHPFFPYMGDQVLHYLLIVLIQLWVGDRLSPGPGAEEIALMWTGAALIVVTRFYEVTWWANWPDMMAYMNHWQLAGYAERVAMLALAAVGWWFVAPLCVVPRLVIAYRQGSPIWQQRRGLLEMALGVVLSVALGIGLRAAYAQI
jgi:hypothetical protein